MQPADCIIPAFQSLQSDKVGDSPSWLRHRILIPTCVGSNPTSPARKLFWGFAKLVKASDFDSDMRRFESYIPSQIKRICFLHIRLIFYGGIILISLFQKQPALGWR